MTGLDRKLQMVAVGLAAMAGMVDAIGFMASGGFFLSFMSGNSTRLAVGISEYAPYIGFVVAILISFVTGVFAGSLTGYVQQWRDHRRQSIVLLAIAAILALIPFIAAMGYITPALCCAAFCMGAENTIFARKGAVTFGVTYMTGALVKIGQGLAALITGRDAKDLLPYIMLWTGLIAGAVCGAVLFGAYGINAIWLAALISMLLAITTSWLKSPLHRNH
jgi:uncharacterized membrane protein YoaK (UPF0700 family)